MANYKKSKKKNFKKRSLGEVRSYWVGVGMAIGRSASNGNVKPYFDSARHPKSLEAGWGKEMSNPWANTPSTKAKLFNN